jgi:hypothetical protein
VTHYIKGAVEGIPDEAALDRLCRTTGNSLAAVHGKKGKHHLDRHIAGYNNAARFSPWVILRDMNHDAQCPPELVRRLLSRPSNNMHLRIVVREIEAWFLGDREKFAAYFGVKRGDIPENPEALRDPKKALIRLVRKSRKRDIKIDMIPRSMKTAREGPAYASRLAEFARHHWRPSVAALRCESLGRCLKRMKDLKK